MNQKWTVSCVFLAVQLLLLSLLAYITSTSPHAGEKYHVGLRVLFSEIKSIRYSVREQSHPENDANGSSTEAYSAPTFTDRSQYNGTGDLAAIGTGLFSEKYLLAMVYAEQLTSATKHYVSLVNIAAGWSMKTIEPYVATSRLYGTRCLYGPAKNQAFHKYGHFFNISDLDRGLSECLAGENVTLIKKIPTFLRSSYRDIVVVHFVHSKPLPIVSGCASIRSNKPYMKELGHMDKSIVDCTAVAGREGLSAVVEKTLNGEFVGRNVGSINHERFRVSRVLCVNAMNNISLTELREMIVSGGGQESVVFIHWQGERTAQFASSKQVLRLHQCSVSHIQHSVAVSEAASRFLISLRLKRPFLSLHIRSERVIHSNALHPGYQACCMKRLHTLINRIMKKHKLRDVLLVRDYGKYGTDSCFYGHHSKPNWYCKKLSDLMMKEIRTWGVQYAAFDPIKFGTVNNSAFVSLVESEALLQGEVLLTVGFGNFQGQLRHTFTAQTSSGRGSNSPVYVICPSYMQEENLHGLLDTDSCEKRLS